MGPSPFGNMFRALEIIPEHKTSRCPDIATATLTMGCVSNNMTRTVKHGLLCLKLAQETIAQPLQTGPDTPTTEGL
jgi:hypothetical protein